MTQPTPFLTLGGIPCKDFPLLPESNDSTGNRRGSTLHAGLSHADTLMHTWLLQADK